MIIQGRDKDDKYEAEVIAMKAEMIALLNEVIAYGLTFQLAHAPTKY